MLAAGPVGAALGDLADPFEVRRAGLHLDDVRLLRPELDGVFDRNDPLILADML